MPTEFQLHQRAESVRIRIVADPGDTADPARDPLWADPRPRKTGF